MVPAAPDSCPKCDTPRSADGRACPRCGLARERMDAYAAQRDAAVPPEVAAAWARVVEGWERLPLHDALLQQIARHDSYAWAAAKYRAEARARPGDPIAASQLARLRRAAEATLLAGATTRQDKAPRPYRATVAVLSMLIVAVVAGLLYAAILGDRGARTDSAIPAPAGSARPRTLQPLSK
ncbi:MAG: hypothetical protein ACTHU0_05725 [Kofleriaceae bacterium]